ncbi:MAG TPA: ABC transporter substrate-binding protein [Bacillales bacterium]|nr:ABC transporter substrate-binding protein [Bacillales bacterium]
MLKKLRLVPIFLAFVLALAACSGGGSSNGGGGSEGSGSDTDNGSSTNNSTEEDTSGSKEKVTLVWAHGKDESGETEKIIKEFEKKYPNINVKNRNLPNNSGKQHDLYVTQLSAKSSDIDVFNLDVVWPAEFAQAEYVLPLDRFIQQSGFDLSKFNQGALSAAQFKGKQWALPLFTDVGMLFYRKDIVKQAPETWDELIEMAKKHKGEKGTEFGYVYQAKQYEGLVCNIIEYVASNGGQFIKDGKVVVDSEGTLKGIKTMAQITQSDFVPGNITTFTEPETNQAFINGKSVFARNWPYMWATSQDESKSKVAGKVGIAPLPAGTKGSAASLGGWMIGINKYSKHKQAAWKFVKFTAGMNGQKIRAVVGGKIPAIPSLLKDEDVLKANPYFGKEGFQNAVKSAVSRPVAPNYQKISSIIQIEVSGAISGKETPEQAVKNLKKKLQDAVQQ